MMIFLYVYLAVGVLLVFAMRESFYKVIDSSGVIFAFIGLVVTVLIWLPLAALQTIRLTDKKKNQQ